MKQESWMPKDSVSPEYMELYRKVVKKNLWTIEDVAVYLHFSVRRTIQFMLHARVQRYAGRKFMTHKRWVDDALQGWDDGEPHDWEE